MIKLPTEARATPAKVAETAHLAEQVALNRLAMDLAVALS